MALKHRAAEKESGEYARLAELWPDFVGKRWEGPHRGFVLGTLEAFGCRRVFNASLGEGSDTANLLARGFDVTSNELDGSLVRIALETSLRGAKNPEITRFDWRDLAEKMRAGSFDAVMLLGNSLTHLLGRRDRRKALGGFMHVLRPGGILIIDERNYQKALDNPSRVAGKRMPKSRTYDSERVRVSCASISPNEVVFSYAHENGISGTLRCYPFRRGELASELEEAGFGIVGEYSDYEKGYSSESEFVEYVARKPKP